YAELAEQLNVGEEDVIEAMEVGRQHDLLSIDSVQEDDEGGGQSAADRTGDVDEGIEGLGQRSEISWALQQLPPRQRLIVIMRFYMDMSQQDVGERLGISQMHVSRLQQKALGRLRQVLQRQG
ncbi:MAG: sigma-70 family RNA polymerase sigma factor, partial [Armatimonadetes bacterium]|nr:sigma-70 family RNA polymerase sigma factor [Armatimonadota bacterium]